MCPFVLLLFLEGDGAYLLQRVVRVAHVRVARVRVDVHHGQVRLFGLMDARLRIQMETHTGHASL